MLTLVKNVRNGAFNHIRRFFETQGFLVKKIHEQAIECMKFPTPNELPKIHFKIYNVIKTNHIRVYSHMDFKNHSSNVVNYNTTILEIDTNLRKYLKEKENALQIESRKNIDCKKQIKDERQYTSRL